MIASTFDINDFIAKVADEEYLDMIYVADQEATQAERCIYNPRCGTYDSLEHIQSYADDLKRLINFMRYGIKPSGVAPDRFLQIQRLREHALTAERPLPI